MLLKNETHANFPLTVSRYAFRTKISEERQFKCQSKQTWINNSVNQIKTFQSKFQFIAIFIWLCSSKTCNNNHILISINIESLFSNFNLIGQSNLKYTLNRMKIWPFSYVYFNRFAWDPHFNAFSSISIEVYFKDDRKTHNLPFTYPPFASLVVEKSLALNFFVATIKWNFIDSFNPSFAYTSFILSSVLVWGDSSVLVLALHGYIKCPVKQQQISHFI